MTRRYNPANAYARAEAAAEAARARGINPNAGFPIQLGRPPSGLANRPRSGLVMMTPADTAAALAASRNSKKG